MYIWGMQSKTLDVYFKDINKYSLLTKEEEENLILKAQFGDKRARDLLAISNLRFVVTIARKYQVAQVELEDLIQEGNMGLMKSIDKFDPTKKVKFLSYAVWWIKQSIFSFLNEHSRTIRLSLNQIRDNNKYMKQKEALALSTESEYLEPDGCFYSELTPVYIDEEIDDMTLIEVIPNESAEEPDRSLIAQSLKAEIEDMLSSLQDRERQILELYYGIGCDRAFTLDEIGDKLKLTRERVRQIKELTLNRLSLKPKYKVLVRYLS